MDLAHTTPPGGQPRPDRGRPGLRAQLRHVWPRHDPGLCPHGRHLPGVGLRLRGAHLEPGDGLDRGRADAVPGVEAAPGSRPSAGRGARAIRSFAVPLRAVLDGAVFPVVRFADPRPNTLWYASSASRARRAARARSSRPPRGESPTGLSETARPDPARARLRPTD